MTLQPNFNLGKFKQQLEEAASEKEQIALLLGFHLKFWHATPDEMAKLLHTLGVDSKIIKLVPKTVKEHCEACRRYSQPLHKPTVKASLAKYFNHRVQGDLFFSGTKFDHFALTSASGTNLRD